ncbi:hypothetical protein [Bosea rubneri]|uniref:Uncharacterized protein n=1 Tax=Bosea rubneri TaxID=3075434 RepID=A0ABU3S574_9HYPH|nr:hypothetical protein [Bosea sp. ZW T0_25]MDU0339922.1 hypothetical protein [Bosea sp. ZW T0_25]
MHPHLLSSLALSVGLASLPALAHDHAVLRGRLVFADHEKPVVRVLDLDTGEVTHSFDVPKANPGFAGIEGGRFVAIKTGDDAGTIRFLDTGLTIESHGDHNDIEKGPVKLTDLVLTGQKPAHVISGHGQLALFYDGIRPWDGPSTAKAVLVAIDDLAKDKPALTEWPSPGPQHGIVVPLGARRWLTSVPNPAYVRGDDRKASSRPDGFEIQQQDKRGWRRLASFNDRAKADASCKLYHGHAAAGGRHVFGCAEGEGGGMLILSQSKSGFSARKLAYPDERRISAIKARASAKFMVANYGKEAPYDALLRVDPAAQSLSTNDVLPVPGGQPACQFELSGNGKRLANLTSDGKLRIYEIAPAWKELASFEAVPAFDCQYGARTPTPSLAVIGGNAFVSDPLNGRIREYSLDSLKQGLDLPVEGKPANLAGSDAG